jgi:Flp pilus assembly protein TadD
MAIEKDPNYALAYAGLADCYVLLGSYNVISPKEAVSKAKAAATKAIKLDERLAEPHATLATIEYSFDWNFADADADFKNAIELNPNYPTARQWYGEYLATVGQLDEALAQMTLAQEMEPLQPIINRELGVILMFRGDYDQAVNQFLKTLEIDSNSPEVYSELGIVYTQKRMYQEAISEHEKALRLNEKSAYVLSNLVYTYAMSGKTDEARKILNQLQELFAQDPASSTELASAYAVLGEKDKAFEFLEKSYKNHINNVLWLRLHPPLASLRSDPRFADLVRRIGLPQ